MANKKIMVLGSELELQKLRESHKGFIERLEMGRIDITYCKTMTDFEIRAREIKPSAVYYTGKINKKIEEQTVTIKDPKQIEQYILSKGIGRTIRI